MYYIYNMLWQPQNQRVIKIIWSIMAVLIIIGMIFTYIAQPLLV